LINDRGESVKIIPPDGMDLPQRGFAVDDNGYQEPAEDGSHVEIVVNKHSQQIQLLDQVSAWDGSNTTSTQLMIKAQGKCTTDHIPLAGPWLRYRGHLDNIADNTLIGAVNAFNGETNSVKNQLDGTYGKVPDVQRQYKSAGIPTIVVGDHNYGEGSSREH